MEVFWGLFLKIINNNQTKNKSQEKGKERLPVIRSVVKREKAQISS